MGEIERRLADQGLALPPAMPTPEGVRLPFALVQRHGTRLLFSGHGPQSADGGIHPMRGKLGDALSVADGYEAARQVALSVLGSIQREVGSLDRIGRWVKVLGMVNSAPTFCEQPAVINGFSDLILSLWGPERGAHVRSAVGMAQLPFNIPVEVEGELELLSD
ncbi:MULTISPECIES: RidA family protein [Dyella]|uniref:RidA family protein n=2 Tax=Dyella TaxID=231454 RepID=A0A4R0YKG6_9GAMM|nr:MULTISPECIES: RidA family protein [Dyella]TBR36294.1 RidA family protein [Dyella terrae]TCI05951.1 RidA family protein [Dyella soli]